ncbi:lipase family protein [uncultured Sphingomonas sp.]|uniref:lipase family protein n=1 Tax=uncultured Sphingomonas sp. TaxID=158754 RepID=UPI0035CC11A9
MVAVAVFLTPASATAQAANARTLVSATPIAGAPAGALAYRIVYRSMTGRGGQAEATGIVIVPAGAEPRAGRDIVAWTHGTTGIADACAPSANSWRLSIIAGLAPMIQQGYIVVAPDYLGLGSAGTHPFLVGADTAHAVLDAVRAARDVRRGRTTGRFALWGESQGGHAALWSGRLARAYAPELRLVGVAAAAPATDLVANIAGDGNAAVRALMTSYAGVSWSQIYGVPLSTVTGPVGQDLMRRLARRCVTLDGLKLGTKIGLARMIHVLRDVDLAALPRWGELMRSNSVERVPLGVPLLIAQGSADVIIAPSVTRSFATAVCRAGQRIRFIPVAGGDHVTIAKRTSEQTVEWLRERFAGRTDPSDCATL